MGVIDTNSHLVGNPIAPHRHTLTCQQKQNAKLREELSSEGYDGHRLTKIRHCFLYIVAHE